MTSVLAEEGGENETKKNNHIAEDWDNILLKLELDLRLHPFFFMSYLACVRSSIYPCFNTELSRFPTCLEILELCKNTGQTKPYIFPKNYLLEAQAAVIEDKTRFKLAQKKGQEYDYLKDEIYRSARNIPASISYEEHQDTLGGLEIYSLMIGDEVISASWHGQIRLRTECIDQSLDVLLFRYNPKVPSTMFNLPNHKCEAVANFLNRGLPRYEASRLLRISIPVDHMAGLHVLPYPSLPGTKEEEFDFCKPAILGIDLMHPVMFHTRRINCTHAELNKWKERKDFTRHSLGSTFTRYMFCGPLKNICKVVGVLMRFRPRLIYKAMKGIENITDISKAQFGPDHPDAFHEAVKDEKKEKKEIPQTMVTLLIDKGILDPKLINSAHPLDGFDGCFQDFMFRMEDVKSVEQSLEKEILEIQPPVKVKEYLVDHRGLTENYYSFCKGKVVGEDTYHCMECEGCVDLNHWHTRSGLKIELKEEKKLLYPIPLSGKLLQQESHLHETGNASGVDDEDTPLWSTPQIINNLTEDGDWRELRD